MRVSIFKRLIGLTRFPIAFFTATSAATGYIIAGGGSFSRGLLTALAVLVLAAGASALNQFQERDSDALMDRTKGRPLPTRALTPAQALAFALLLMTLGLGLLLSIGKAPFLLGFGALVWYNCVYTALKRVTAFAAVPGAIVGMLPPMIGWVSAAGALKDPRILAVAFVFFMWQVPHFWLQVLHHGEEYERAGLPSLTRVLSKKQISRITFAWICAAPASVLLLPLFGVLQSALLYLLLLPGGVWLIVKSFGLISMHSNPSCALSVFRVINVYILFVMCVLSIENMFPGMP